MSDPVRLGFIVEGKTENDFVSAVLAPQLRSHGLQLAQKHIRLDGNVSIDRLCTFIKETLPNFSYVTTLVDCHGFKKAGTAYPEQLENTLKEKCSTFTDSYKLIPYVQMHEFEALLFANIECICKTLSELVESGSVSEKKKGATTSCSEQLTDALNRNSGKPEKINNTDEGHPSKRIADYVHSYNKAVHGLKIANCVGLDAMRKECPRFDNWLARLETLAKKTIIENTV